MPSEPSPGWFRRHFNADYRIIYHGRDQAQADLEAAAMIRELEIGPEDRVLDLCCGYGRHLKALEGQACSAMGLDLSRELLAYAARSSRRSLVCADMRAMPFAGGEAGFHVVLNFFTSFGYFEADDENLQAAREIHRVLRPGGRFALDLMNAATAIESLVPCSERRSSAFVVKEARSYDSRRRRIEKSIELIHCETGASKRYFESVRLYQPHEILSLLVSTGLRVDRFLGDFQGGAYTPRSERMIVLGRRPE